MKSALSNTGDRLTRNNTGLDMADKDDKEEKKYSAEEKEVSEAELKKSVSERKKEIERRISEEQEKKKDTAVKKVDTKVETKEKKKETLLKDTVTNIESNNTEKDEISIPEKETCEEKSITPEPAELTFDEKRLSFELGHHLKDKKVDTTQKFLDSEKMVYQVITGLESEPELTFQEKRLSFEKGLKKSIDDKPEIIESKIMTVTTKKIQEEFPNESLTTMKENVIETTQEMKLVEDVTKGVINFLEQEKVISGAAQGTILPVESTTPPSTPSDVLKAKGGEDWQSIPTSQTDGEAKSIQPPKVDDAFCRIEESPDFFQEHINDHPINIIESTTNEFPVSNINIAHTEIVPTEVVSNIDVASRNPFENESDSPTIFRSHQAADFVIFDDEDWDTQDVVEFNEITGRVMPRETQYVPEKFLDDSKQSELRQGRVEVFDEPFEKTIKELSTLKTLDDKKNETIDFQLPEKLGDSIEVLDTIITDNPPEGTLHEHLLEHSSISSSAEDPVKLSIKSDSINNFNASRVDDLQSEESTIVVSDSTLISPNDIKTPSQSGDISEDCLLQNIGISNHSPEILNEAKQDSIYFYSNQDDDKSDLLRQLDEFIISPSSSSLNKRTKEKSKSSVISDQDRTIIEKVLTEDFEQDTMERESPHPDWHTKSDTVLKSRDDSVIKLEDELDLLEKLEDQIKMLKEEETKMIEIKEELKIKEESEFFELPQDSDNNEGVQPTDSGDNETGKEDVDEKYDNFLEKPRKDEEKINNETINKALLEAQNILSKDSGEQAMTESVTKDEPNKKKKNRKRKSKKAKEGESDNGDKTMVSQSSSETIKSKDTVKSLPGTGETGNSEREFQRMVSQLSVEEVDEALQIWNKNFSPNSRNQSGTQLETLLE